MVSTFDKLYETELETAEMFVGPNDKDEEVVFIVSQIGSKEHDKAQRKYSKQLERSRKNPKRHQEIMAKIAAISLLKDWRGVLDENGDPVEATPQNRYEALKKYRRLLFDVIDFASDPNNFREDELDEVDSEDELLSPEEETEKN